MKLNKSTKAYRNKLAYTQEFTKQNYRQINLMLHKENDADIIEFLDSLPNKNGYLKDLIRHNMKSGSR